MPTWAASTHWIHTLDDAQRAEIDAALQALNAAAVPPFAFGRGQFPLPKTAPLLAAIRDELEHGTGLVRLRGVDVRRYGEDDLRQIFWGLGCYLGTPLFQNPAGEIMGEVRDETKRAAPASPRRHPAAWRPPAPGRARPGRCGSTPTRAT